MLILLFIHIMHDQISGSRTMKWMGSVYLFIFWIKMFTIIKSTCIKSQSHLISYATNSMIQYPKVARDNLVLQNGPGRNVYSVAMVSNDDHSSSEAHCSKHQTLSLKIKKTLVFGYSPPLPKVTPCLAGPQPQVRCQWRGPPLAVLIHTVECKIVGPLNYWWENFAELQIF